MNTFLKTHLKIVSFSQRFFMKCHHFFGIDFRIDFSSFFDEKGSQNGAQKYITQRPKSTPGTYFFDTLSFMSILLRSARPPTHLHAPRFIRSAAYSRRNFLAAQFLFFLANRGGPRGGPRAPCKRPRAKGPKGPKGPSGPLGQGALRAPGPLRGPGGPLIRKKCYP